MQKITRIGVFSLGKLMAGIGAAVGLFIGLIFTVVSFFGATFAAADSSAVEGLVGLLFGVGALFVMPIFYGTLSFIQGIVVGFLANVAFKLFGGLEVELS